MMKAVKLNKNMLNTKYSKNTISSFLLTACIGLSAVTAPIVHAETTASDNSAIEKESVISDSKSVKKKTRVRRAQTMRPKIFKKLDKIRELSDAKDYEGATSALESLSKMKRNSYETAMTWNMYAYMYFNKEDYSSAAKAYEKIISGKRVPESLMQTTLYSLAKLYLIQQKYTLALESLNHWFDVVEKPNAQSYILRAQVYYQLENYKHALPDVKQAISITVAQGKKPRENWLLMERAVYFQNKDYVSMERCLKDLIAYYPKSASVSQYWVQLSAIYNELGKSELELSTLETAYEQGLLKKEAQLVNLAQAMLGKEIPYKSAQIMLMGMKNKYIEENAKNLSLLGDALMLAKEYEQAISVMAKAADLSDSSKDYYKLAQIYTERQEWNDALSNVDEAIEKNDPNSKQAIKVYDARILKGLVLFNMKDLLLAKAEFELASESIETKKMAGQWLTYIASEEKRMAFLAGSE
jgi:tetratricopeptide (TPR) repeat protein